MVNASKEGYREGVASGLGALEIGFRATHPETWPNPGQCTVSRPFARALHRHVVELEGETSFLDTRKASPLGRATTFQMV